MKEKKWSKIVSLILIGLFFGGFIISLSWTFGDSISGQIMGTLEGIIIILIFTYIAFFREVNVFFKGLSKFIKRPFSKK